MRNVTVQNKTFPLAGSVKNCLPTITNPVYGYNASAKSGVGRRNPDKQKATPDAKSVFFIVAASAHLHSAANGRPVSMVALVGQPSGWPVSFCAGIPTPISVIALLECRNSGGDSLNKQKEAAIMATVPTQNPQFIWLIAAVRRDCPAVTARIHHIVADSEHEARRTLVRDHICFFAGRLPVQGVCHV